MRSGLGKSRGERLTTVGVERRASGQVRSAIPKHRCGSEIGIQPVILSNPTQPIRCERVNTRLCSIVAIRFR